MIYLGIGCVVLGFMAWLFSYIAENNSSYSFNSGWFYCGSILAGIGAAVCCIIFIILGFGYKGAQYKANIINREYGTEYTKQEIFYAEDVIDTIRQLDRKRIEINGNLLGGN